MSREHERTQFFFRPCTTKHCERKANAFPQYLDGELEGMPNLFMTSGRKLGRKDDEQMRRNESGHTLYENGCSSSSRGFLHIEEAKALPGIWSLGIQSMARDHPDQAVEEVYSILGTEFVAQEERLS